MTTATKPTFAKTDGTARKNLYHSHLVRAASGGGVMLKIKGEPIESKYPKPNCSHVVFLQFPNDEQEYALAIENETLEQWRKAPRDHWIMANPSGSAQEPAAILFSEAADYPVYDPAGSGEPIPGEYHETQDAPPPLWPDEVKKPAEKPAAKPNEKGPDPMISYTAVDIAVRDTVLAVNALKEAGIEVDPTPIYSTHYIQASRR